MLNMQPNVSMPGGAGDPHAKASPAPPTMVHRDLAEVDERFPDYLTLAQTWIRHRSSSQTPEGLRAMAAAVAQACRDLGAEVNKLSFESDAPLIVARLEVGAPVTVLLYGMYDVMPAEPQGWIAPPFVGEIAVLPERGPCLIGRGAENTKGPLAGMFTVLRSMLHSAGTLPVNVVIIVEGEEETGSHTLRGFLRHEPLPFQPVAALFPVFSEYGGGAPRLFLGFKGIIRGMVSCRAGPWGGPRQPAHSSASWIASPAWHLIHALAALASPLGDLGMDAIGADDSTLEAEDRTLVHALAKEFHPAVELEARHAARFSSDNSLELLLKRLMFRTTLNISRLRAGEEHALASIPPTAEASFDVRLAPNAEPEKVIAHLRARLASTGLEGLDLTVEDAYPGCHWSADQPGVQTLLTAYQGLGVTPQVWPVSPGAAPAYAFARAGAPLVMGGLGHGGNAHSINEYATLEGMRRFARSLCLWLHAFRMPANGDAFRG